MVKGNYEKWVRHDYRLHDDHLMGRRKALPPSSQASSVAKKSLV